jgi:hypothetical protein
VRGQEIKVTGDGYRFLAWGDRVRLAKGNKALGCYGSIRQAAQRARRHREKGGK